MVKYRQTKLDEFPEYRELIKGCPIVKFKWNQSNEEETGSERYERKQDDI